MAAVFATAILGACADGNGLPPPSFANTASDGVVRAYRLNVGDKLKINVFGEENLSGQFEVNASGNVSMPLVGDIRAKGLTLAAFRQRARKKLADGYLKNPRLAVEILNYRPIFVHGEVRAAGQFEFKNGLKIRDAIAMAGGYTYRANQAKVIIAREGLGETTLPLPSNVTVLPGDNIRIPERFF